MTQKSEELEDLRIRRSRKMLQQALIELSVEKGFAAITVREITERAMVNRSTFYRHYLDKYDLLNQYMDEVYQLIADADDEALQARKAGQNPKGMPSGLLSLLKHIQQFRDFYRVMLGPNGDPVFIQRLRQNAAKRFRVLLSTMTVSSDPNAPPLDLKLTYVSYAGVGAIVWWLEQDQPISPEELATWVGQLSTASMGLPTGLHGEASDRSG